MKKYFRYGLSLVAHKWFVLLECINSGIPFTGLFHDLSKFRPSEFVPYARYYGRSENEREATSSDEEAKLERALDKAWLLHQKRNCHHWQHWVLIRDDGTLSPQPMEGVSDLELLCDWRAFGRQHGNAAEKYYRSVRDKIFLAQETRELLDDLFEFEREGRRSGWMGQRLL